MRVLKICADIANQTQNYTCVTDRKGVKTKYVYNARNKLIGVYKQIDDEWIMLESSEYDSKERPRQKITYTSLTDGTKEIYSYDCISRPVVRSVYTLDGEEKYTERTAYSVKSGKVHETKTIDELPVSQETTVYDEFGKNCGQIRKYGDTEYSSTIEYDYLDRKIAEVDPRGARTEYAYDTRGNLVSKTDSSGAMTTYSYDMAGRKLKETDARQNITHFTYDELGRISTKTAPGGSISYTYDPFGRIASETADGRVKTYTYDACSNVTGFSLSKDGVTEKSIAYEYDSMNRLTKLTEGDKIFTYTYDVVGNLTQKTAGNITTNYTYNNANAVTLLENTLGDTVLSRYTCNYTPDGKRHSEMDNNNYCHIYTYDTLGRLVCETQSSPATWYMLTVNSYTYDTRGNRTSITVTGPERYSETYTYDRNNRIASYARTENGDTRTTSYTYDLNGNLISEQTDGAVKNYTYDVRNRLVQMDAEGVAASYTYNADGLRASKTVNGVRNGYVWNGMNMICETSGSDITDSHTYDNMGIAMTKRGDAGSIYLKNAHNDIMQVTDFAGEIQQRYRYDAFGRAMAAETEPDETTAAQSIMNVTPEPISTPAPEYDELQAYTADSDTTYVAMQEGKVYLSDMPWKSATNVYGDGELLAQTDYMTGSDDGQALSVDVGNVQVLKLSATNNGSNNHNHADWADAKLTPKTQTVDMGYFGYCGEYYDPELDMIYLRNRYYSPGIGRFITEDPARDGANWYAYCNNNPVMFVDPSGLSEQSDDRLGMSWWNKYWMSYYTEKYNEVKNDTLISTKQKYSRMNSYRRMAVNIRRKYNSSYRDTYDYTYGGTFDEQALTISGNFEMYLTQKEMDDIINMTVSMSLKADIKQVNQVAREMGMTDNVRREFGDYIERLKGKTGKFNDTNFSWKELVELAKEFLGQ